MNLDWIKDIQNYEQFFNDDHRAIIDLIGIDNYLKLVEHFSKTGIYFGSAPITQLKREWAVKNKHINYNEAARTLNVSAKTIYNWRQEAASDNLDLF